VATAAGARIIKMTIMQFWLGGDIIREIEVYPEDIMAEAYQEIQSIERQTGQTYAIRLDMQDKLLVVVHMWVEDD